MFFWNKEKGNRSCAERKDHLWSWIFCQINLCSRRLYMRKLQVVIFSNTAHVHQFIELHCPHWTAQDLESLDIQIVLSVKSLVLPLVWFNSCSQEENSTQIVRLFSVSVFRYGHVFNQTNNRTIYPSLFHRDHGVSQTVVCTIKYFDTDDSRMKNDILYYWFV